MMRKNWIAECIGTFILVFCGTGAIVINHVSNGAITHPGIAMTFGIVVMVLIYALGPISGAHMNPVVTVCLAMHGQHAWKQVLPYSIAQCIGAIAASCTLQFLFPLESTLGNTIPSGSYLQSFILEILLTFILVFVILRVTDSLQGAGSLAGVLIGATVGLDALFGGPISGASMNPVRSLAPALVSGHWEHCELYLIAPLLGGIFATLLYKWLK